MKPRKITGLQSDLFELRIKISKMNEIKEKEETILAKFLSNLAKHQNTLSRA